MQLLTTPLSDAQLVPQKRFPAVYVLDGMSHGMEYPVDHFGSAALAVSSPKFSCPSSFLAGWA